LTTKRPAASIARCVGSSVLMHTSSRIGSSDTEATALAVMPAGAPSRSVVITVTPVTKCEIASRKATSSTPGASPAGRGTSGTARA
jgi:hypothetical protein